MASNVVFKMQYKLVHYMKVKQHVLATLLEMIKE